MACPVCEKIKDKKAHIVYEDDELIAVLPARPAAPGHIRIMPKQHAAKLDELDDITAEDMFFLANYCSSAVFEGLQAQGTNIIMNESDKHLFVDVIPRKENDGLDFMWKPKQLNPEDMEDAQNRIKDKTFAIGKSGSKEEKDDINEMKESQAREIKEDNDEKQGAATSDEHSVKEDEGKTNYLIQQLRKIP